MRNISSAILFLKSCPFCFFTHWVSCDFNAAKADQLPFMKEINYLCRSDHVRHNHEKGNKKKKSIFSIKKLLCFITTHKHQTFLSESLLTVPFTRYDLHLEVAKIRTTGFRPSKEASSPPFAQQTNIDHNSNDWQTRQVSFVYTNFHKFPNNPELQTFEPPLSTVSVLAYGLSWRLWSGDQCVLY